MSGWEGSRAGTLAAYAAAADGFAELVGRVHGDWDRPGLGRWDLRALVGHTARALVTVTTYLDRPADAEDVTSAAAYLEAVGQTDAEAVFARGVAAGADLGDDPYAWVSDAATRAVAKVRASDPDAVIETIAGGMRVAAYVPTRTFELVVHGLDLAAALDLEADVPAAALHEAAALATEVVLAKGRGAELLLTLTGRADWPADLLVVR